MKESSPKPPIYAQIALDVANRIARGELPEKNQIVRKVGDVVGVWRVTGNHPAGHAAAGRSSGGFGA